jgi:hypothetical protein
MTIEPETYRQAPAWDDLAIPGPEQAQRYYAAATQQLTACGQLAEE